MDKNEFKEFCKKEFYKRGYKKIRKMYYLVGTEGVMSGIDLQKSNFGGEYYVNFYFFIGDFEGVSTSLYPTQYEYDVYDRIPVMSKKERDRHTKECFITGAIEYLEYTEETLRPYFDKASEERILPAVYQGKQYILENLNKLYRLSLRKEEVLKKLQE